ncbi:hypothetical protein A6F68_01578 [Tsuneonella dongtanensis]|uniref:DUF885 domain-containing protein n=1 Tax=Tsuneonella dongtanensis TaxID=692370 RepID=A0A1B2ADB4_9SPHN|nr:DUF885 domain-containing protein [Tsuneonella dongtanensis]ANY20091.1 hypothetical protein A6F68_01578 [Tsuneonella dongtanensis]
MTSHCDFTRRQALAGLGGVSVAALSGCATTALRTPGISPELLLEEIAWNLLEHKPGRATSLGVDTGTRARLRGLLEDTSAEGQAEIAATLRSDLARARAVDTAPLDAASRTSFEVVESAYSTALDGFALPYGDVAVGSWRNSPYVVLQNVGAYLDLPRFMSAQHPVRDRDDAEAYLSRLEQIPRVFEGELGRIRAARSIGLVPPGFLLDKAIGAMERSIADARSAEGTYVTGLTRRSEAIPGNWGARARALTPAIAEALDRLLVELKTQRSVADMDPGMWSQPRGDEWYAWGLRAATTTRLTPDEIHSIGLRELDEIHARMDTLLQQAGYAQGSVGDRMKALAEDPRYKFSQGDAGRAEIMAFIEQRLAWIKAQMPRAFAHVVDPNMEVRRLPLAEEPGGPGAYGGAGSKDGTIPGRMWINLRTTDLHRKYDLPTLTHHEMVPGHIWQGEYSNRLPLIRSILSFSAFSEGWALYAEQLADELGAYDENPQWRLGYLQSQAFRACRLVVDTGLHHKRWSRQQGVDFFVNRNGDNADSIASEVDRYCSWPGQACGYKIGHTEMNRQRTRAKAELGARFDLRAFNQAVVDGGNVPLDVMARTVSRYVAGARS